MTDILLDAPGALLFSDEEMGSERPARLLEAGEYPDKGLTLTEEDLDRIVAGFAADVPVKVEHVDSPLDPLGQVRRIWREGTALLGTLAFPDDLAGFLRRRGAAKLSVGLTRDPLLLREVSLVLKPRVPSATLMAEDISSGSQAKEPTSSGSQVRDLLLPKGEGEEAKHAASVLLSYPLLLEGEGRRGTRRGEVASAGGPDLAAEIVRLRAELTAREVDAQIAAFKAQGRIVPASEGPARALLAASGENLVTLAEGPEPVARAFRRFLEAQPPVILLTETAPTMPSVETNGFTQYEHTFLADRLGVDPVKVAALLRDEAKRKGENDAS